MNNYAVVTSHGLERGRERRDFNKQKMKREFLFALRNGKSAEDFCGKRRNYMLAKQDRGCYALAYNGFCFIVSSEGECITMYKLPEWFLKKKTIFYGSEEDYNEYFA